MMFITPRLMMIVALAALLIWPVEARVSAPTNKPTIACACCADDGEWYEISERLRTDQWAQLDRLRFAATANRLERASDEGELASTYTLSHRRTGRRWELRLRDEQGKSGTLSFTLPASAVSFATDLRDHEPGSAGPILYKEWRFTGPAQVTGIFKKGMTGASRFRLVLQGRGNNCSDATDFKHWTLQVSGGPTTHAFYGTLDNPE